MNKLLLLTLTLFSSVLSASADKTITVTLKNPTSDARQAVPVVVKVDADTRSALVKINGKEVACQLDDLDDDGIYDELAFVTDLGKKETLTADITLYNNGEPRQYPDITYGSIAIRDRAAKNQKHLPINKVTFPKTSNPYQYIFPHGPIMENDMVGFRVYADHRQAIDYYGHQQLKADIAETAFYPDSVQKANGSGDDVLWTGSTYGCGALHGWDAEKNWSVMYDSVRNTTLEYVCSGPVRTILRITNRAWQPLKSYQPVDVTTTYTLYAHHRDVQADVKFSHNIDGLPLSTGTVDIADHNGAEQFTDKAGLRACWGTAWGGNNPKVYGIHTVGLAVCVPTKYYKGESHFGDMEQEKVGILLPNGKPSLPNQANVVLVGTPANSINYWFAATCDMESFGFKSSKEWFQWLKDWKRQLNNPVQITQK